MEYFPKIGIEKTSFEESRYVSNKGNVWEAKTLYKEVKKQKCKKFKLPLAGIDLYTLNISITTLDCFVYHMKRVKNCSLDYPIILGPYGTVMDGNHRIAKALLKGKTFIWAYRLQDLPEPDKIEEL